VTSDHLLRQLLDRVAALGVELLLDGEGGAVVRWPEGLPPGDREELLAELRAHKPAILAHLNAPPPPLGDVRDRYAAWAGAVLELGELLGFPRMEYKPGHAVGASEASWRLFKQRAGIEQLRLAVAAARAQVFSIPHPAQERD
jgi:hypothetical protein